MSGRDIERRSPSVPDLVASGVIALFAFGAGESLTQSDGDLFAHIRLGQLTVTSGHVPAHSLFGFATLGVPAVFPSWLSAVLFAWLDGVGGLALIVAVTATIAGLTHGLLADLFRRRSVDATRVVLASVVGIALASAHWLARPH